MIRYKAKVYYGKPSMKIVDKKPELIKIEQEKKPAERPYMELAAAIKRGEDPLEKPKMENKEKKDSGWTYSDARMIAAELAIPNKRLRDKYMAF
jgi:hypothetical protein